MTKIIPRLIYLSTLIGLSACDALLPPAPEDNALLDGPMEELTQAQRAQFLAGDELFGATFTRAMGLGPIYNASSCDTCHPGDGRAHPEFAFERFGRWDGERFDPMVAMGGPQLQDRSIAGYPAESKPAGATASTTLIAPPVTGLGLLEAVDDDTLLALADPEDEDGDGISGRISWVPSSAMTDEIARRARTATRHQLHARGYIGRFGRKAGNITLLHQTVAAFNNDMGITSTLLPEDPINTQEGAGALDGAPDPEVSPSEVDAVAFYLSTLRPPARRGEDDQDVLAGERVFDAIGCAGCHLPSLPVGESSVAGISKQVARAYTDLLLHDMGDALDDGYTEGTATSAEWRTPPLWGLGLAADFQGGELYLMHDGRARSLDEAITLHGGEAAASRDAYEAATAEERAQLILFLESL